MIECEIKYELNGPIFRIIFQEGSQKYVIESKESPSATANNYIQVQCERKNRSSFRPFNALSESMKMKHSRAFSIQLDEVFKNEVSNFFNSNDKPVLQQVRFHVQDKDYLTNYHNKENDFLDAFVKAVDQGSISQNAYRNLAALQPELPRDHNISDARKKLNKKMNEKISIIILNIKDVSLMTTNQIPHINNPDIENEIYEMLQQVMGPLISELHSLTVNGIEKDMDQLKKEFFNNQTSTLNLPPSGYIKPPLLPMIPLNCY
ncbi:14373_t:CDS:2, partial [Racocetra fulgida]